MDKGTVHGIYTLLFMSAFIVMGIWVYLPRRKKTYDEVASLPLSDTDEARNAGQSPKQD
jgi:cbb3-type cytochrome oxidase subunit 3